MSARLARLACASLALLAGCGTFQGYDGPKRPADEVAIVRGNTKVRTQMPVAIVIRSVDGREVDLQYSSVSLTPGKHELVVDCQVGGVEGSRTRHVVQIEVGGGERYRLRAEMRPGNRSCDHVEMDPA